MELFRFLNWWWGNRDASQKALTVIFSLFAWFAFAGFVFGGKVILATIVVVVSVLILWLLKQLVYAIIDQWNTYVAWRAMQHDKVVSRLRGH
jgi:hypothetical protein